MPFPDLFHYQKFDEDRLRPLLVDKKLYMASPDTINDPWDCQPHYDVRKVHDPAYREGLADRFRDLAKRNPAGKKTPQQLAADIAAIRADPKAAFQVLTDQSQGMRASIPKLWRLYCLTPHADSQLMWAHYGDSHKGIALQYIGSGPLAQEASQVTYLEHYPAFDFLDSEVAHAVLLTKSNAWAYEDEYRVFAWEKRYAPPGGTIMMTTENNFANLKPGSLSGIVVGALATSATEEKVKELVALSGLQLVVQRAVKHPDRYGLTFQKIV